MRIGRRQADSAPNASIVDLRCSQAVPRSGSYWRIDIITPTALPFLVTQTGARRFRQVPEALPGLAGSDFSHGAPICRTSVKRPVAADSFAASDV